MAEADQVVAKQKNYDFLYKNRRIKTTVTADHPLRPNAVLYKPKASKKYDAPGKEVKFEEDMGPLGDPLSVGRSFDPLIGGKKTETKKLSTKTTSYDDPFYNPLEDPLMNPLSRPNRATETPKANQKLADSGPMTKSTIPTTTASSTTTISEPSEKKEDDDDNDDTAADNLQELKTVKEQNLWTDEIKDSFLKVFKLKNLEQLKIENPFKDAKALMAERQRTVKYVERGKNNNVMEQESETAKNNPHVQYITYSLYIKSIENIKRNVLRAWANNDKVLALQLTIQSTKLLIDTKEIQFYPLKYVYVVDVLEIFSTLVFERIKGLSFPKMTTEQLKKLKETDIVEGNINDTAKDICRNWFIKCAVIRELLPRIYIEIALLKNMVFTNKGKIAATLLRLSRVIRGIANPLVAGYAMVYLIRVGSELLPKERDFIKACLVDSFLLLTEGSRLAPKDHDEFFALYDPVLENGFRYYARNCKEAEFKEMLKAYEKSQHTEILKKIIKYFGVEIVSDNAIVLNKYIKVYQAKKKFELYTTLCEVLVRKLPPKNVIAELYRDFLEGINEIKDFEVFLNFTAALLDFLAKSYDGATKNQFLHHILLKFNEFFATIDLSKAAEQGQIFNKLQEFMEKIVASCESVNEILSLEPFLQFVTYLPSEMRIEVCKKILQLFAKSQAKITDPMVAYSFISIAKNLNDNYGFSINLEQRKEIAELLKKFISNVDYGKDLEATLNLYTEVRSHFGNMPGIMESLINYGLDLCMKCKRFAKGRLSKKVIEFIQATISFCLISIVTIEDPLVQIEYYFQATQMALLFNLVSQAETLLKSSIGLLKDIPDTLPPKEAEAILMKKLRTLISYLIVVPENPENDHLHIFNGLYAGLDLLKWDAKTGYYAEMELRADCLAYLCSICQESLPYHVENVKSNDELYRESDYKEAIASRINEVAADIHARITDLGAKSITDNGIASIAIKSFLYTLNILMIHLSPGGKTSKMIADGLNAISSLKSLMKDRKEATIEKLKYLRNTLNALEKYDRAKETREKIKLLSQDFGLEQLEGPKGRLSVRS